MWAPDEQGCICPKNHTCPETVRTRAPWPVKKTRHDYSYHWAESTMPASKADKIDEVKAKLPLPEQPPTASDWQSADARNVNVGTGRVEAPIGTDKGAESGLREPATRGADMDMSGIGKKDVK
ncbi:hypothetical protein NOR_03482 [Metarhizium rileyi]|uniref:Uncharacterized protein n=1 Tax=Metarhizium rileyi (strain RCEF 4871) TaxID=1649241 RepID=A0A162JQN2_METRR|nr:hypothetical protein NOR_03482 [Metarhizium rileyi RCEF 4871]